MTRRPIAIAFHDDELADVVKASLIAAGETEQRIEPTPLRDKDEVLAWLATPQPELLVLDAEHPTRGMTRDPTGRTALALLKERGDFGRLTPTLVITKQRNPASELEAYCTPGNAAIAMPEQNLKPQRAAIFAAIFGMIGPKRYATWKVVEIEVRDRYCKCSLGDGHGRPLDWDENKGLRSIRHTAAVFDREDAFVTPGWLRLFDETGRNLFDTHVIDSVGKGLFAHIEKAAGGLSKLAFRFRVEAPELYAVPFEASVRALDEDPDSSEFVLLRAPVARWLPTSGVLQTNATVSGRLPDCVRILFIRSQVGEHPDGGTRNDLLAVGEGKVLEFKKLRNIDKELEQLTDLADKLGPGRIALEKIDLSKDCPPGEAAAFLEAKLKAQSFDVLHFAGHSWSSAVGTRAATVLVLPGEKQGWASRMRIEQFAELAGNSHAQLVYLSSCQGSSARSILSLVRNGVQHALGFRCNVEDDKAAKFAADFYKDLFKALYKHPSICEAFCTACSKAREALDDEDPSPIWASPILVAQTEDWAVRI